MVPFYNIFQMYLTMIDLSPSFRLLLFTEALVGERNLGVLVYSFHFINEEVGQKKV